MRILLTAGWLGGHGGAERALFEVCNALVSDEVDVVVHKNLSGELSEIPNSVNIYSSRNPRFINPNVAKHRLFSLISSTTNGLRRRIGREYDIHMAWGHGPHLTQVTTARTRLLVPSGNRVNSFRRLGDYSYISHESPAGLVKDFDGPEQIVIPPPVGPLPDPSRPGDLPSRFLLTVFNPYSSVKGMDDLAHFVESLDFPIVWCHSDLTIQFSIPEKLQRHSKIIHVLSPTRSQQRWLFENCEAYVCFSKSESFGWAIADALRYSRIIVSRAVGVLSDARSLGPGIHIVNDFRNIDIEMQPQSAQGFQRDMSWLSPQVFRDTLISLKENKR